MVQVWIREWKYCVYPQGLFVECGMGMGRKSDAEMQEALWIAHTELPRTVAHPFYEQAERLLEKSGSTCLWKARARSSTRRRWGVRAGAGDLLPPAADRVFRGHRRERGIAWRVADSLALRQFLGTRGWNEMPAGPLDDLADAAADRRWRRIEEVFGWVLGLLAEQGLLKGKTVGVDATTLEANAAMRSIVRRDTGEGYRGVSDAAGAGIGDRDADARASGAAGSQAQEEGFEQGLDEPARSGCARSRR